jgi:hypothetical protein
MRQDKTNTGFGGWWPADASSGCQLPTANGQRRPTEINEGRSPECQKSSSLRLKKKERESRHFRHLSAFGFAFVYGPDGNNGYFSQI